MEVKSNQLVRIEGRWAEGVSGGILCKTGRFIPLEEKRERVLTPMVRKNGELKAATMDEALAALTATMKPLLARMIQVWQPLRPPVFHWNRYPCLTGLL